MKILTTFLITTAALLLTSCGGVGWNLFYCVRELPNTCTGVDLTKPVGGTVYVPQSKAVDKFPSAVVMQVPEVTYSPSTRPVCLGDFAFTNQVYARGVEPTGRTLWVKVDKYEHGVELLPGLPKQVEYTKWSQEPNRKIRHRETLVPYRGKNNLVRVDGIHNPPGLAQLSTSRSAWGPLATMAALPLYPVDCVLGLASNTLFYSGGLLWAAVNGAQQTEPKSYGQSTSPLPGEGKEK